MRYIFHLAVASAPRCFFDAVTNGAVAKTCHAMDNLKLCAAARRKRQTVYRPKRYEKRLKSHDFRRFLGTGQKDPNLSTRRFGGDVKTPAPRGGLTVCPKTRGLGKCGAMRIDAFLMMWVLQCNN